MSVWEPDNDVLLTDSEDEENEFKRDFRGREAMLFVLDANLVRDLERFQEALEIVRGAFISGLLINDKDLLGVMFANTDKSPTPYEPDCLDNISMPDNCAVFLPLRQLTKDIVEHYLQFLRTASDNFFKEYGVAGNDGCGNFNNMIRLCINLFDNCGYSLNNSTIVFMTDRDTPHAPGSDAYQAALQKAPDLEGKEIEFQVIPMVDDFDYGVFYKEFITLTRNVELESFVKPDAQQLREILADRKLKQDYLKRTLGHFDFCLGPGLEISVQYYNYFQKRNYPRKVTLMRDDNSIIKKKRVIVVREKDAETMEFMEENEIKTTEGWYEINLGARSIAISPEQMLRVRNLHAPGMMLLGFKPKTSLSEHVYYKPCNFMYPDDKKIIGSKRLFRALWQRCLDREKIAICLFMRKRKSNPRYVALVPVKASENDTNLMRSLLSGDGFKIIYLPSANHIRHINYSDWYSPENSAPDEGVTLFEKIIKKLRIKYQPNLINDRTLELLQAKILAMALDIKTDNSGLTEMPDASKQDERIEQILPDIEREFGCETEVARKRPASAKSEGNAAKIAKISEDNIKSRYYVQQLVANKALLGCTIAQLRTILEVHFDVQLPKGVSKTVLTERIYDLSA